MSEATTTDVQETVTNPQERPTPSTESPTSAEPSNPDAFIGKDFEDPYWGRKAKNMWELQKRNALAAKKAERELAEYKENLQKFWSSNPDLAKEAQARIEGKSVPTQSDDTDSELSETDALKAHIQQLEAKIDNLGKSQSTSQALIDVYARLGNGDIVKGEEIYRTQGYDAEMTEAAQLWNKGPSDRDAARALLEYVQLKREKRQPKPPEPRVNVGTTSADIGPSAGAPIPSKTGDTRQDAINDAMKALGVGSAAEWAAATAAPNAIEFDEE